MENVSVQGLSLKFLCYFTGHRWGAVVISLKGVFSSGEELCVLCE
jgi:hypothetical protein